MSRPRVTLFSLPWCVVATSTDFLFRATGVLISAPRRILTHGLFHGVSSMWDSLVGAWFISLWHQGFAVRRPRFLGLFEFSLSSGARMSVAAQLLPLESNPVLLEVRVGTAPAGRFLIEHKDADRIADAVTPQAPIEPVHDLLALALPWLPDAPERVGVTSTFRSVVRWLLW